MQFRSMRVRMTAACLVILMPFLLFSCNLFVRKTREAQEKDREAILRKMTFAVSEMVSEDARAANAKDMGGATNASGSEVSEVLIRKKVSDALIRKLENFKKAGITIVILDGMDERVLWKSQADAPFLPIHKDDPKWHVVVSKAPPRYLLVFGLPRYLDWRIVAVERYGLWGISAMTLLVVGAGAWLLVGQTLLPIRQLARQADTASVENLKIRLHPSSQDREIVHLVETLNGMLGRLSEAAAAKGRFYAAASHELRTPLQALSGHLELALSRPRTVEEYERSLNEAYTQTNRLTVLVRDLLLLHQLDGAATAPSPESVDLAAVCAENVRLFQPLMEARSLCLRTDLPHEARIMAIPTHAEIILRNLIENAVKYARPDTEISLRLVAVASGWQFETLNACPLVGEDEIFRLFEPFYRPDAARNRKTGGNGLGLTICHAIASVNGWTVQLQQEPAGIRAVVLFY